jgi:hypothetical protein
VLIAEKNDSRVVRRETLQDFPRAVRALIVDDDYLEAAD